MSTAQPTDRRWWTWVIWLLVAALGLKFGFDFGSRISGVLMGVTLAVMTAVFGTVMVDGLVQWLTRLQRVRRQEP